MEQLAWLSHFQENTTNGRPAGEGWYTSDEMAKVASISRQSMEKYIKNNPIFYEKKQGTLQYDSGRRRTSFYRFIPPLRRSAKKRLRKSRS